MADNFVKAGQAESVLVIGAETFSRLLDWEDRRTCVLFGDGAGAVVLRAEEGTGTVFDRGVLATHAGLRRAPLPATSTSTADRRRPAPPATSG